MEKALKEDPDDGDNADNGKEDDTKPDVTAASNAKDDCSDLTGDNNNEAEEQPPKSFPQRLMDILSDESTQEVISWLPHGTGFQIHKKKTFANDILPHHFKASKFTSFTRKLNRWGFARVPRGPETGAYFHKLFRRDKPELVLQMTSNSGNKYQSNAMHQQLMPNVHAVPHGAHMMMPAGAAMPVNMAMPAMFPYMAMPNPMMANMTPQQQHVMWQQQMQQMMVFQQQQMMQMQQQNMMGNMMAGGHMGLMMNPGGGLATSPMNGSSTTAAAAADGGGGGGGNNKSSGNKNEEIDAAAETTEEETKKTAEEEV